MTTYLIRRILLMFPTLLGMTLVVFFIMKAAPGDTAQMLLSREGEMKPGDRAARVDYIKKRYNLDKPLPQQYLLWLNKITPIGFAEIEQPNGSNKLGSFGFKTPDLGRSFPKNRPVADLVAEALPITLILNLITIPIIYALAILTGVYAGRFRGQTFDVASGVSLLALWSIPTIWAGVMLQGFLANRDIIQLFPTSGLHALRADSMPFLPNDAAFPWIVMWLCIAVGGVGLISTLVTFVLRTWREHAAVTVSPIWLASVGIGVILLGIGGRMWLSGDMLPSWNDVSAGWLVDSLWHLCLPVVCLAYGGFAFLSKLNRGAVLENLRADFTRTARAKGVNEHDVLWHHVFRNSLLPLITVAAHLLPGLIGGAIIVEYIFGIPGMGKLMIESIELKDQEVVMAVTLASGLLAMTGYLIADLLYLVADPRISYE